MPVQKRETLRHTGPTEERHLGLSLPVRNDTVEAGRSLVIEGLVRHRGGQPLSWG